MKAQIVMLLSLFFFTGLLQAQTEPRQVDKDLDVATVTIDGIKLFPLRGISAYPAKRRAREVEERIEAIASDETIGADQIKVVSAADRTTIVVNETRLVTLLDADADLAGIERNLLAEVYLGRIKEIIEKYRVERSKDSLLKNSIYVVVATVLLIGLLIFFRKVFVFFRNFLLRRYEIHINALKIKSVELINEQQARAAINGLVTTLKVLVYLLTIYLYLQFALSQLPWTRTFAFALIEMTLRPLHVFGEGILEYADNVVFLIVLFFVIRYVLKLVSMVFAALRNGRITISGFEPEWSWPTYRLVRILLIAFSLVIAFPYIPGSESAAFKGVTLFLGVLFSLGSSTYVSNIIAGYTMTYRRAFRVGDRVRIGDIVGDVNEIRLLVTHLRSLKNEEIIIPNSKILNTEVINYHSLAKEQGVILHTTVGIGYEVPWRQVEAMLLMAAQRTSGLLTEPKPFVLQKILGDFAVTYELNAFCKEPGKMMLLYSSLHQNIQDVFNEYGVQIMTPAYVSDTPEPKIVPRDKWFSEPAKQPETK